MNADWTENRIGRRMPRGLYMLRPTANDFAPVFMDMEPSTGFTTYRLVIDRFSGDKRDMNVVYLGDRLVRWMHDSRLPDTIKSKVAKRMFIGSYLYAERHQIGRAITEPKIERLTRQRKPLNC